MLDRLDYLTADVVCEFPSRLLLSRAAVFWTPEGFFGGFKLYVRLWVIFMDCPADGTRFFPRPPLD